MCLFLMYKYNPLLLGGDKFCYEVYSTSVSSSNKSKDHAIFDVSSSFAMNGSNTEPIKRSLPSGLRVPTKVSSSRFKEVAKNEGDEDEENAPDTTSDSESSDLGSEDEVQSKPRVRSDLYPHHWCSLEHVVVCSVL